jgi:hypothetical protein
MQTTSTEQLPCKLTEEERQLKSDAHAQAQADLEQLELDKASASSSFGAAIKKKKQEISKLAKEVRTREEVRPVECVERPRYDVNMVDLIRLDTKGKVSSRPMHPHERQSSLDLDGKKDNDLLPAPKNARPKKKPAGKETAKRPAVKAAAKPSRKASTSSTKKTAAKPKRAGKTKVSHGFSTNGEAPKMKPVRARKPVADLKAEEEATFAATTH